MFVVRPEDRRVVFVDAEGNSSPTSTLVEEGKYTRRRAEFPEDRVSKVAEFSSVRVAPGLTRIFKNDSGRN